jgi:Flp pilus assembly pilin Flp
VGSPTRRPSSFLRDARGGNIVEYILLVGLVAIIALGGYRVFGNSAEGRAQAHAVCVANLACGQGNVGPVAPSRAEQIDQAVAASTNAAAPGPGGDTPHPGAGDGAPPGDTGTPPAPPSKGLGERALDVGKGIVVDGLWGTVTGLWGAVTHPVETVQGIGHAVTHPIETATAIKDGVVDAWNENPERLIGAGIFEVITLPLAAAKVSKATKLTKVAKVAENADDAADAAKAAKAAETADDAADASKAADAVDDPAQAAAALAKRKQELGTDPKRGYIEHEGEVGAMIEDRYGGFKRDPSGDGEWISKSGPYEGKTFDLLGIPEGKAKFHSPNLEKFLPSVDSHFRKSIDHVVLDTRHMTPDQKATVMRHIDAKWAAEKHRLILIE